MNKEDKKIQEDLVNEMMKVSKTNPDVMIYMQSLMKCYEDLEEENKELQKKAELGEHYKHLYSEVKKQKDDVVEYIKENIKHPIYAENVIADCDGGKVENLDNLLRMLGEIDNE